MPTSVYLYIGMDIIKEETNHALAAISRLTFTINGIFQLYLGQI
jgi:hypothetical protein